MSFSAETGEISSYRTKNGNVFSAEELANFFEIVRDENGVVLQIWNYWDGLMNIEEKSATGYEIALYLPEQVGEKSEETGLFVPAGTAFKRFIVKLESTTNKLKITEQDSRAGAPAFPQAFWFENGAWNSSTGAGTEEIITRRTRTKTSTDGFVLTTETIRAGETVPARNVSETFIADEVLGNLCTSRTEACGTAYERKTFFSYDDCGRVILETRDNENVSEHTYDRFGRVYEIREPRSGFRNQARRYTYLSSNSNDSRVLQEEEILSGTSSHTTVSTKTYTYAETAEFRRVERRTTGLGSGHTHLEITETWTGTCGNAQARGRVKMTQSPSGVQTHFSYAATELHGALYAETRETRIDGNLENGKSSRTVRYISAEGNALFEEKFVLDSSGTWRLVSSSENEYDARNNLTKRTRGNGRVSTQETMCCGVLWTIDEDGVRTDYSYDSAQQLTETMRAKTATTPERITVYERDAAGFVLRETVKLDGPTFSEKTKTFDMLGRVVSETDELGRETNFSYSANGLTETKTLPNGATLITTRHADGSVLSETGTGQRATETEVSAVEDGIRTTIRLEGTTGDSGILSRTIANGLGEEIRTVAPNANGGFVYTRKTYDSQGRLIRSGTDNLAPTLYEYDAFGNETKRTLALADTPSPSNSRVEETQTYYETRAGGVYRVIAKTTYNAAGTPLVRSTATLVSESATLENETISTDIRGNATRRWTEFGTPTERISKTQIPTAENIAEIRLLDGFTVSQIDHAGTETQFARQFRTGENAGITLQITDGRGNTTTRIQNVSGWTTQSVDASGATTSTEFELSIGKPACVTDALGKTHCFAYDLRGNAVAEFGTGTQPVVFEFDAAGRKISQKLFRANTETIETDPRSREDFDETRWEYHETTGLLLRKIYPDGNAVDYAYDAFNRLSSTQLAREVSAGTRLKITRAYKALSGELVSLSYNDGATRTEVFGYDFLGNQTSVSNTTTTTHFVYDAFGEIETETVSGLFSKTITRHRDALGRDVGYSLDGVRKTTLDYDAATGRVRTLTTGTQVFSWEYLAGSALKTKLTYPNGATAEWTYEAQRDLLTQVKNTINGSVASQYVYANDALGRRVSVARSGRILSTEETLAYGYDTRGELTNAVSSADANYAFSYAFDNIGNRISSAESGAETSYSANESNQYAELINEAGSAFVPNYDADGNATLIRTSTGTWAVDYNGAGRPVSWTKQETGEKIYMMYDALGRRIEKRVLNAAGTRTLRERYVYDGFLCVQILDGDSANALEKAFVWDPTEPLATRPLVFSYAGKGLNLLYTFDGNKNVSEVFYLVNANGIGAHYDYSPFGAVYGTTRDTKVTGTNIISANPWRFSSEFCDAELNLVHYTHRNYSPELGRFLSRDPIQELSGFNLYAFCKNNSIAYSDYSGLQTLRPCSDYARVRCKKNICEGRTNENKKASQKKPPNGCGSEGSEWVPDSFFWIVSFTDACDEHDRCYETCSADKNTCDDNLGLEMAKKCRDVLDSPGVPNWLNVPLRLCLAQADIYVFAVKRFGESAYEKAQDSGCVWDYCCKQ